MPPSAAAAGGASGLAERQIEREIDVDEPEAEEAGGDGEGASTTSRPHSDTSGARGMVRAASCGLGDSAAVSHVGLRCDCGAILAM